MSNLRRILLAVFSAGAFAASMQNAFADDAAIRKNIAERFPDWPKVDEISKTPIPGIYELRFGTDIFYTDEQGNHVIEGTVMETKSHTNLTEARISKLTAIDFASLPLKDAIVWKQGTGARKLVIFADPNCGYCKKFERDLQQIKDVTVYTFLYPILGGDSPDKSRNIWCAKDNTKAWRDWMLEASAPARIMGACDTGALTRNVAFGRKYKINGTPALIFEDGKRIPGALPIDQVEKNLASATPRKAG
ncbi:MAG: DsbC family protein [Burkholderiales bacterium]|jgi:thiol:disulfide interchange protein DsbC|nr:DsbC family protein [Burkholderiales bacterium]